MHMFLLKNRDELIARCRSKVARRRSRGAKSDQLATGVPTFLEQLQRTLAAEDTGDEDGSIRISGMAGGEHVGLSEMGITATAHGKGLVRLGFSVDQVVHDYGDLCQAITDLSVERDTTLSARQFRTLNRCLDNAIASAVSAFTAQRDRRFASKQASAQNERIGNLVHELRNHLNTATLALKARESGAHVAGATDAVLKRSLDALAAMLTDTIAEVQGNKSAELETTTSFELEEFIADAVTNASVHAAVAGCTLTIAPVDPTAAISGNRTRLLAALGNILQNAFKFTQPQSEVVLNAYVAGERVFIDVRDQCGGLPEGFAEQFFKPFARDGARQGMGLGLSIARRSVEASGGELSVRNVPGTGCVFTLSLQSMSLPVL